MVVVACIYYDSVLEKTDFPTITPLILRQARKNEAVSKIYNCPPVITKNDDEAASGSAGRKGRALGDKGVQEGDIGRGEIKG